MSRRVMKDIFLNLDFLDNRSRGKSLSANLTWEMPNHGQSEERGRGGKKVVKELKNQTLKRLKRHSKALSR